MCVASVGLVIRLNSFIHLPDYACILCIKNSTLFLLLLRVRSFYDSHFRELSTFQFRLLHSSVTTPILYSC